MKKSILMITTLLTLSLVASLGVQNAKAAVQNFHLYGSYLSGWGLSPTELTNPTLTVNFGDEVNLTITNLDVYTFHQFLLSYENSSTWQTGDPLSPQIPANSTVAFSFTADVSSGTFTYYCTIHPDIMNGLFVILPPIPEYSSLIVLSLMMIAVTATVLVKRRNLFK